MQRYEKIVLEADRGITFVLSGQARGELIIRAQNIVNGYFENFTNPPIPEGYKHTCGDWNNGFVIERRSDGSQFVWVPVGSLDSNGTLDGKIFSEKFGRRNYTGVSFSDDEYHEALKGKLIEQFESVKKYGGFYISRYNISESSTGKPQSVKGVKPWVDADFTYAREIASTIENNKAVKSHLTFGAEYDSVLEWLIRTKAKTFAEIADNSVKWGNYRYAKMSAGVIEETGSIEGWCANNIYDLAGNVHELTQEENGDEYCVIRSGCYLDEGKDAPAAERYCKRPIGDFSCVGFRAALWIK